MSAISISASERERLILAHLPQVYLLAHRLHRKCPPSIELDDLISCGTLGLIQAVDRFEPQRGYQLKTLAEHRIRGAMADYLRKLDPLSRTLRRFVCDHDAMTSTLTARLGRTPDETELAQALGLSIPLYRRRLARIVQTVSLDALGDSSFATSS